ncbi:hypothetical protein WMY93_015018 [Mugilogobius chulae]|uniref:Uncharacterized protein n=1 Tax=Mugilogobius chulae TaxID=88201 RepID=A0AAW0NX58_9GOBI
MDSPSLNDLRPNISSPSGVGRECDGCGTRLLPEDGHQRCFFCLGWRHFSEGAQCQACASLPREERARRSGFLKPVSPVSPGPPSGPDSQPGQPPASIAVAGRTPTKQRKDWADYDEEDDLRCYEEDVSSLFSADLLSTTEEAPRQRYPIDLLPELFEVAAGKMEVPLPPQPATPPDDFTSVGASRSGSKRRPATLCPRMEPIFGYATRDWGKPLAARRPGALGYAPYCTIQDWPWKSGLPPIEDGVRLSLLPSSSMLTGGGSSLPSERDRMTMSFLNTCYANAAQVVALASNMAFLTGSLDKSLTAGEVLDGEDLERARTTSAALLRMAQAFALDGGRSMGAAQVAARHLWLGLSNLKDQEKRRLLDLPISTDSLFGPDMQKMVDRLDAASKASAQLAQHLQPRRDLHRSPRPPARSDRSEQRSSSHWKRGRRGPAPTPAPARVASRDRAPPREKRMGREPYDRRRPASSGRRRGVVVNLSIKAVRPVTPIQSLILSYLTHTMHRLAQLGNARTLSTGVTARPSSMVSWKLTSSARSAAASPLPNIGLSAPPRLARSGNERTAYDVEPDSSSSGVSCELTSMARSAAASSLHSIKLAAPFRPPRSGNERTLSAVVPASSLSGVSCELTSTARSTAVSTRHNLGLTAPSRLARSGNERIFPAVVPGSSSSRVSDELTSAARAVAASFPPNIGLAAPPRPARSGRERSLMGKRSAPSVGTLAVGLRTSTALNPTSRPTAPAQSGRCGDRFSSVWRQSRPPPLARRLRIVIHDTHSATTDGSQGDVPLGDRAVQRARSAVRDNGGGAVPSSSSSIDHPGGTRTTKRSSGDLTHRAADEPRPVKRTKFTSAAEPSVRSGPRVRRLESLRSAVPRARQAPPPFRAGPQSVSESASGPRVRPLTDFYHVWKELGLLSEPWLERTLRRGYALQFARKPPPFQGILITQWANPGETEALRVEVSSLLHRGAVASVSAEDVHKGLYSPYFLVPKKSGGARPILDLRLLNEHIKSSLQPAQSALYLGLHLDSQSMRASLSAERSFAITQMGQRVLGSPLVPAPPHRTHLLTLPSLELQSQPAPARPQSLTWETRLFRMLAHVSEASRPLTTQHLRELRSTKLIKMDSPSLNDLRPNISSPSGVGRECDGCGTRLLPEDGHQRCFFCLGWRHFSEGAQCQACASLPRRRERALWLFETSLPCEPGWADSYQAAEGLADYDEEDDLRCYEEDVSSLFSADLLSTTEEAPRQRYPIDLLPELFEVAAGKMEVPLPPQPATPPDDFTSVGASRSGSKRRPATLCPRMEPIFGYATRDWGKPLAARRPGALGYAPYCTIQDWPWKSGLPPIEDGVRLSLLPSSSMLTGAGQVYPRSGIE